MTEQAATDQTPQPNVETGAPSVIRPFEHLQLLSVRLIDLRSHLVILNSQLPNIAKLTSSVAVGPSADQKCIHVNATLVAEGRPEAGGEQSSLFNIQMLFQCVFTIHDAKLESLMEHATAIAHSGMLVIWPHFRELVLSLTTRMGLPPFVLPMYAQGGAIGEWTACLQEQASVLIKCPVTGNPIKTGITLDRQSFESAALAANSINCPHCGGTHSWSKQDAWLEGETPKN